MKYIYCSTKVTKKKQGYTNFKAYTQHSVTIHHQTDDSGQAMHEGLMDIHMNKCTCVNSHLSPGPLNCGVLCTCLMPQCSYLPTWPCHQWHLTKCDWMSVSYPTFLFSQASNLLSFVTKERHFL